MAKQPNTKDDLSFFEHLEELRWHVIRALISVVVFAIIIFALGRSVFDEVILAPRDSSFITYQILCATPNIFCLTPSDFTIETIKLGEQFFVHLKVSILLGIVVSFPYIFWELWRFIKPGLYSEEAKAVRGVVFTCSFLFLSGVLFGYFVIAPFAVSFLSNYSVGADTKASLTDFVNLMTMFTIPTGMLFQLPVLTLFLTRVGLITPQLLRKFKRHAFIIILILAAIITPPDIITQLLIGFPLYALYEFSIIVSKRAYKKRQKKLED